MRGKLAIGLICILGVGLGGCTEQSKEVSLGDLEDKLEVNVEYIKNDEGYDLAPKFYVGKDIYAQKFSDTDKNGEVLLLDDANPKVYVDKNLYKISGNKIEKTKEKNIAPKTMDNKKVGADYTLDKDGNIEELFYYNQEKGVNETLKKLNIESKMPFITPHEMVGTSSIDGEESVLLSLHNGDTKDTVFNLEVIDIKTKKSKKINKEFNSIIRWGFFKDEHYYFIDEELTLYKVLKDSMKVILEENLRKGFGVSMEPKGLYIQEVFLKENGELFIKLDNSKVTELYGGPEKSDEECILKYNLNTKEYINIDNKKELGLRVLAYSKESEYVVVNRTDKDKKEENYIGKIEGDKLNLLKKLDLGLDKEEYPFIIHAVFNEKGNEVILGYFRILSKTTMDNEMHYATISF
ncbi:MAG: hypothetical protein ACRC28_01440 [Clostridium sp.]|uniref:hypothetical protein n=1 Tax=Clostridium sp. TaxID=1506 RepID=UPI003F3710AE